ncbi:CobW domain-containing protein [Lyophyllum atratum]|nr:CobW domain-containing protein [Lyophyllum atratum]
MDSDDEIPTLIERDPEPALQRTSARVPLTIICGFLGAGKSTLLKRILTERHGYRIAVIMNEFGDTADIESKTVNVSSPDDPAADQSEEILELANGCLCCSIKDSGAAAIEKLMQRKGAFDHILLETTGLADPGPIASIFWHNEEFASGLGRDISLDGVICVVDAFFGTQQMEEDHSEDHVGESLKQIAGSDVILLNKVDLVTPETLAHVESLIRRVNPAAPVHRTVRGDVDLGLIMGIAAFTAPPPLESAQTTHTHDHDNCDDPEHTHPHEHEPTHYELRGISSLQVSCPVLSTQRFERLDEWIRCVLWENRIPGASEGEGEGLLVLRCKGLIMTEAGEQYVLQGVRSMYDMTKIEKEGGEDIAVPQVGKIVLIGKGLDESVRRSLENIMA